MTEATYYLPPVASGPPLLDRVHHCDALALLRALPDASIDAIIVDPPYGLAGRVFDFPHKQYSAVNEVWDRYVPLEWMDLAPQKLKRGGQPDMLWRTPKHLQNRCNGVKSGVAYCE